MEKSQVCTSIGFPSVTPNDLPTLERRDGSKPVSKIGRRPWTQPKLLNLPPILLAARRSPSTYVSLSAIAVFVSGRGGKGRLRPAQGGREGARNRAS